MECCNALQYLEGAAYIAIVLAVLGVPQLLTYYFERRDRRRERAEDRAENRADSERLRELARMETERLREADRVETERRRDADRAEAERVRELAMVESERRREADRAEAERVRREERVDAERRHLEMMTALVAMTERNGHNGHNHPAPDPSDLIAQMQQRIDDLENNVQELRQQSNGHNNGNGAGGV